MGVDFGGGDLFVAQHFLNRSQISTGLDQVGCKAVPKRMWRNALSDLCLDSDTPQHCERHLSAEASPLSTEEHGVLVSLHWNELRTILCQVIVDGLQCSCADGNGANFVSFSDDLDNSIDEVHFR